MKVGIIGAGPAGSLCASILSKAGAQVLLFDYRGVWEKPCGGGVTHKALVRYPFLRDCLEKKRTIERIRILSPKEAKVTVTLQEPLFVYSRNVLNEILLQRAVSEGACLHQERVLDFERQNSHWQLKTEKSAHRIDFLIGADGVNSFVRKKLSGRFVSEDLMMTYGYRLSSAVEDSIEIKFVKNFPGYLWAFPRPNNVSIGICAKLSRHKTETLKQYLHKFLQQSYGVRWLDTASPVSSFESRVATCQKPPPTRNPKVETRNFECEMYSALIPSLRSGTLRSNKICGPGWALLGDAAGFADPITCEGIYYALRSGELLARALIESRPSSYPKACEEDFIEDFIHAAELFEKFYTGNFLGSDFITRMVQTTSRSKTLQSVMNSFIAGRQNYKSLRANLIRKSPRIFLQVVHAACSRH